MMGYTLQQYLICPDCGEKMAVMVEKLKNYVFITGTKRRWTCKQCNIEVRDTTTIYPGKDIRYIAMFHETCGPMRPDKVFSGDAARFRGGGVDWFCDRCHKTFVELLEIERATKE